MFTEAVEAKAYGLAWQIRQDLESRALGRPFVALNPEADKRHELADISRIAIAIKSLTILQAPEDAGTD